jgi:hypothetical protein
MEKEELINKMQSMQKPEIISESHQVQLKITLLSAKRSAKFGIILAILPSIFLGCIFLKYLLHLNIPAFSTIENWMAQNDKNLFFKILMPLILIGGPLIALAVNLMAIFHMEWKNGQKEILMTLKLKWPNITIIAVCLLILACFFLYLLKENMR